MKTILLRLIERWQPSESVLLGGAALVVGLLSGVGVWLFKLLIQAANYVAFTWLGTALGILGSWARLFVPVIGGLVVGLIVVYLIGEEKYHGVAGIMEAEALA